MKIRPVGDEYFHADVRKNEHDKSKGLFRNFANAQYSNVLRCCFITIFVGFRLLCFSRQQTLYEMCYFHTVLHCI